jgi:hypothetical protein
LKEGVQVALAFTGQMWFALGCRMQAGGAGAPRCP